jgi:hypothetical protein
VAQANPHSTLVILERVHKIDTKDQKTKKRDFLVIKIVMDTQVRTRFFSTHVESHIRNMSQVYEVNIA